MASQQLEREGSAHKSQSPSAFKLPKASAWDKQPKAPIKTKTWQELRKGDNVDVAARNKFSATSGKFLVNGKFPPTMEKPLTDRNFELLPPNNEIKALSVLTDNRIAAVNMKGLKGKGDTTIGQDAVSVSYLGNGWWLHIVADGHGVAGDKVSSRVMVSLPLFMSSDECFQLVAHEHITEAFNMAFGCVQEDIETVLAPLLGEDILFSGTTCVCMLGRCDSQITHIAHIGDSKAIMFNADGVVQFRTNDHKPENSEEQQRVEEKGCEVVEITYSDGTRLVKLNIKGQQSPAIAFTRSFGDQSVKKHGVHAIPEVGRWDPNPYYSSSELLGGSATASLLRRLSTKFMGHTLSGKNAPKKLDDGYVLLASDGIWEFMTPEEVGAFAAALLEQGINGQETLNQLVLEARDRWSKQEDDYCDDITALLVPISMAAVKPPKVASDEGCFAGCCSVM